jgi:creatinine amidohydrolase
MRLQLMSWPEVEKYLEDSEGVIVPIGATEQHGPTGLIGTDAICAETLAWRSAELTESAVAPTLSVGMSEHHMAFPGSISLRPTTLVTVVRDVVLSLARHGFRRFFFINGHGGNTSSLDAAFFEVYTEAPRVMDRGDDVRCLNAEWWDMPSAVRLSEELFGDRDGDHATASEVSVAAAAWPGSSDRGISEDAIPTVAWARPPSSPPSRPASASSTPSPRTWPRSIASSSRRNDPAASGSRRMS